MERRTGRVVTVVGMQYGSEGKGAVTSYLAPGCSVGVRSGAANAGHTIYFRGQKFIMRQIPTAWINPFAKLVIGIGALLSLDVLFEEIALVEQFLPIRDRLFIDSKAHVITSAQVEEEMMSDLAERIGSTSAIGKEGIGVAMAEKVLRKSTCRQAKDTPELKDYLFDTVELINDELDREEIILLEGTQGIGLSLEHGEFPFVTSRDTSAAALAASVGISPHHFFNQVIGVTRTYPIRVAGNSGPFGEDSEEISWEEVAHRAGSRESIMEKTSVTNRVRRVATFSESDFVRACRINRPTEIALTFADYLDWSVHEEECVTPSVSAFMERIEMLSDAEVMLLKTGPNAILDFDSYRQNILRRIREE